MKRCKKLLTAVSILLCVLISCTLPVQVFAQSLPQGLSKSLPKIIDEKVVANSQEAEPYKIGNILSEITEARDEYSKQFLLDDGTYMIASYDYPIHYKNSKGVWVNYDNSLVSSKNSSNNNGATNEYENKSSNIKVKYSVKAKDNNMIKINSGNYSVSWGYKNANNVKAIIKKSNVQLKGNQKFTALKRLTSEVVYKNVYNNVDLQYFTTTTGIKENIILNNSKAQSNFYIQYKIGNLKAQEINNYTVALKDKLGKVVYVIEAPYMTDAEGKSSTQLTLKVTRQKNGKLTLKLTADKSFLLSSDCKYPVTIDPTFTTSQNWQTSECTYVDSKHPNTAFGYGSSTGYTGTVYVGDFGYGLYRTYVKMKSLPKLNKGDMVVSAYLNLHLYRNDFYQNMNINAHFVKGDWTQSKLTWKNQPSFEGHSIDYETFVARDSEAWHNWDVTQCVKRWYNGEANNGIMLKSYDESRENQCAGFYSSNYPEATIPRPLFTIVYRNNKGLEDYWTYSSFQVGSAGTAYVNDYSGNLVFVASDASTVSGVAPATVEHIYNGYMAGVDFSHATPKSGKGWQLNINQTLIATTNKEIKKQYPYVYTDGDGTEHYFYKKTEGGKTKYLDEDGLGLELTINSSSTYERFVIKDEKGNKLNFIYTGRLDSTVDANGNKIKVNYTGKDTVVSIKDGSGNLLTLNTVTQNNIKRLNYIVDPANRKTSYVYNSSGYLIQIKKPNNTTINYTYDSAGSLTSVTDVDGYKVKFSYTSATSGKKVSAIQEYAADGTAGQKITFERNKYNTTVIRSAGVDGVFGNTDDIISNYQFDNWGRTIIVKTKTGNKDLGASVYKYTAGEKNASASNIKQLNRVITEYSTGSNAVNLIRNPSFESSSSGKPNNWGIRECAGKNIFTASCVSEQKYFGQKSLKINVTYYEGDSKGRVYLDYNNKVIKPGHTYTLSGYIKTVNIKNNSINSGALLLAESFNYDGTSNIYYSDFVYGNTSTYVDNGWQRVSTTFKVPTNSKNTRINLMLGGTTGTAYFDGIQLEEYSAANDYNLIENAGMDNYSSNGMPTGWSGTYLNTSVDRINTTHHYQGATSFRIKGEPGKAKEFYQIVNVSGTENDTYILSGWAKANAVAKDDKDSRKFKISLQVKYSDGSATWKSPAEFNHSIADWQYSSVAFNLSDNNSKTNKKPVSIKVFICYQNQGNYAYFDDICLIKDNAQSYTYDKDGKLISVVDNSEKQSTMEYTNSDLTKSYDAKGYAYEYKYDSKHNLTKATSQNGVTYNYKYNNKGLSTSLEVKGKNSNNSIKTEVTYDNNGLIKTAIDQDGNVTSYNYNSKTGTLSDFTDSSGNKTSYTYDLNTNQVTSVSKYIDDKDVVSVNYTYSADDTKLTKISHNGTDYSFEYDKFGNRIDSKVGTQSLAKYSYGSNNGLLNALTYGTGETVGYTYDAFGNTESIKYNGKEAFHYYADRGGNVIREKDYINDIQYEISSDSTGRLVRKTAKYKDKNHNTNNAWYTIEYSYDLNNNITRLANKTPYRTIVNSYSYGKDNLLTKFEINGVHNVTYSYDDLNRLTKTSVSLDKAIDTTYKYAESKRGTGYTTTKLESETIDGVTYSYEYDKLGNITRIFKKVGDKEKRDYYYEYDKLNQLDYVYDYKNSKVYRYIYDSSGNIVTEIIYYLCEYGYPTKTELIHYSYDDSNWTDKLTSYNGQAITYDAIGNPLNYRDGIKMTWKNGRQLSSLQNNNNSVKYSYDSNSVRVSKVVNGTKYTYEYLNGLLLYETRGEAKFYYSYDTNGTLYSVRYTLTDTSGLYAYYYTHNSRGDIVGIYNSIGELRAEYEYDAWGKVLSITDQNGNAITNQNHIGNLNPFRYRGYYYDSESGFYYLQSRYYDPVTRRFINADGFASTGQGILGNNMFAYCGNNSANYMDKNGEKAYPANFIGPLQPGDTRGEPLPLPKNQIQSNPITYYGSKVLESVLALICSIELDADIGYGLGFEMDLCDFASVEAVAKASPLALHYDYEGGFDFGQKTSSEATVSVCMWDMISYGSSEFYSYCTEETNSSYGESHFIGFSAGIYVIAGGSISVGWNLDYFCQRCSEIW